MDAKLATAEFKREQDILKRAREQFRREQDAYQQAQQQNLHSIQLLHNTIIIIINTNYK
jgi:ribosomal protein L20